MTSSWSPDRSTPTSSRENVSSSAQGLIALATYGIGILIGSLVSGVFVDSFATTDGHEWRQIWIIPAIIAAVVLVMFLLLFKDRRVEQATTSAQPVTDRGVSVIRERMELREYGPRWSSIR